MAEQDTRFIVMDGDGNAIKIKADSFFVDQGLFVFQQEDSTGGRSEVAAFGTASHVIFNEDNVVQ